MLMETHVSCTPQRVAQKDPVAFSTGNGKRDHQEPSLNKTMIRKKQSTVLPSTHKNLSIDLFPPHTHPEIFCLMLCFRHLLGASSSISISFRNIGSSVPSHRTGNPLCSLLPQAFSSELFRWASAECSSKPSSEKVASTTLLCFPLPKTSLSMLLPHNCQVCPLDLKHSSASHAPFPLK